jgi:gliding motility-associated-like protein
MNRRLFLAIFFPVFLCCSTIFAQTGFFIQDSITLKLNNCNGKADFCFDGITPSVTQGLQVSVNGVALQPPYNACKSDTLSQFTVQNIDPLLGPYRIDSVTIGTKKYKNILFANAQVLTDSLNKWDPTAKWVYDDQIKRISGTPQISYSSIAYTIVTSNLPNTIGLSTSFVPKGLKLSFDRGAHKVVASGGIPLVKDSIYVIVACSKTTIIAKEIKVGETDKFCFDASGLPAKRIVGILPLTSLVSPRVEITPLPGDSCVSFKGLKAGKDTFAFVLRGLSGINDTNIVYLTVKPVLGKIGKHEVTQFVKETKTITYCIDTDALLPNATDSIKSIVNYCGTSSGTDAKFTITGKNKCITIEGIKAGGVDTACVVITNQSDQKDTTIIYAYVIKDCKDIIKPEQIINATDDCLAEGEICIPSFKAADTLKYQFFADGSLYKGQTALCDFQDISGISYGNLLDGNGKAGPFPYTVDEWDINGQKFTNGGLVTSLQAIVDVLNQWNPAGNWKLDTVNLFFRGGDKKNTYKPLQLTNQVFFTQHSMGFNFGTTSNGVAFYFKKGFHNLVLVEKGTGCTDTLAAIVHCAKTTVLNTTIFINQKDTFCLNLSTLVGKNITITNNPKTGKNVTFTPSADKKCVYFVGNKIGKDTIVTVACDEYNVCDTTYLYVDVVPRSTNHIVFDTINVNGSNKLCVDTLFATGKITSFVNTSTQSGTSVKFVVDPITKCITYTGTAVVGTDTAKVIICDENNICDTTTLYVTVRLKPIIKDDLVRDTVTVNTSFTYCLPKDKFDLLFTSPLSVKNICEKTTNKEVTFTIQQTAQCNGTNNFGYALIYTGVKVGVDTACIEVTDATGKKDTLKVLVAVIPRKPITVYRDTVLEKASDIYCLDAKRFNLKGAIDTAYNACPTFSGKDVAFVVERNAICQNGYAIRYTGIKAGGVDTACVVVKDKLGNTDTLPTYVYVKAIIPQPKLIYDTVFTYQTKRYCIDTAQLKLNGGIDSIWNACPKLSGEEVVFSVDKKGACTTANGTPGLSILYTGAERGIDTACFVIADDLGKLDTIRFIVTVIPPQPSFLIDKVEIGKSITLCPDTTQLFGKNFKVTNICPNKGGTDATFTIDTLTKCVKIVGLKIGKDTACIVVCDDFNSCDTTYMYIEVVPVGAASITAVDDSISTTYPKDVIINVLGNDKFDIKDTSIIVIKILGGQGPKHGLAIVNPTTRTVQYIPDPNTKYCGKDTFFYYITVGVRTDTARVIVTIKCDNDNTKPFKVYTGFSPNDDGKNDTFTVDGIDSFPGNEVIIYNRWGNQIYRKKEYDNSWDGTWEGKQLPDGTYWYVLCLPDGNNTKIEAGYVELRR